MFTEVGTVFSDFCCKRELAYAGDIALTLKLPLAVYVRHDDAHGVVADIVRARVATAIDALTPVGPEVRLVATDPLTTLFPPGALMVGNAIAGLRPDVATLAPADEARIFARGPGPVMVPLGAGESGQRAARAAVPLAELLGMPLLFWHTTWRRPDLADPEPGAHLCDGARRTLEAAQRYADAAGVGYRTVLETADGVAEGLSRGALREQCVMVVMARGRRTTVGRYAQTLLARTIPVPLLTVDGWEGEQC